MFLALSRTNFRIQSLIRVWDRFQSTLQSIAHLFFRTVLTRDLRTREVITFFLFCLASIDASLTAIVGDRLLLYWYSTIAAGGVCVPTGSMGSNWKGKFGLVEASLLTYIYMNQIELDCLFYVIF